MLLPLGLTILSIYLAMEFISGNEARERNMEEEKIKQLEREAIVARSQFVTRKVITQVQSSKATLASIVVPAGFDDNRPISTKRERTHGTE